MTRSPRLPALLEREGAVFYALVFPTRSGTKPSHHGPGIMILTEQLKPGSCPKWQVHFTDLSVHGVHLRINSVLIGESTDLWIDVSLQPLHRAGDPSELRPSAPAARWWHQQPGPPGLSVPAQILVFGDPFFDLECLPRVPAPVGFGRPFEWELCPTGTGVHVLRGNVTWQGTPERTTCWAVKQLARQVHQQLRFLPLQERWKALSLTDRAQQVLSVAANLSVRAAL